MSYATDLVGAITVTGVPEEEGNTMVAALEEVFESGFAGHNSDVTGNAARQLLDMDTEWKTRVHCVVNKDEAKAVQIDDFQMERFDDGDMHITGRPYCGGTRRDVFWQLNWIMSWAKLRCPDAKFFGRIADVDAENPGESAEVWFEPDEGGGAFCIPWGTETVKRGMVDWKYLS